MSMRAQGCHVLKRLLLAGVSAPALVVPVRGDCAHLPAHAHRMHSRPGVLCVQETLRMYPPVGIGQGRVCQNHDTIVGGHLHLPAGTCIAMPHHTIHNASFNWDDHDKFLPGEPPTVPSLLLSSCIYTGNSRTLNLYADTEMKATLSAWTGWCSLTEVYKTSLLCAERCFTPGTLFAVGIKLLLPKQWHAGTDINADLLAGQGGTAG